LEKVALGYNELIFNEHLVVKNLEKGTDNEKNLKTNQLDYFKK